ncbi:MAG: metal ABC transporter ATP-binding protein [Bacteroidales bacterium]|nr:metal ABC transporter ATP-binding protein [Bacteroidales bacterium]NPV37456.1 metal ABC transporter ATP-binding protein [Bacteroidales bacterium]
MNNILEIKNLTAGYNGKPILRNVNLTVREGDFIGIIGPNGGGKTTLIKTIAGLLPPVSGEIIFHFGDSKGLGYLPQVNTFDKRFPITTEEVILSGLMGKKGIFGKYTADDKKYVEKLMEKLRAGHLKGKSIGSLSGGQMQRVFLARALVARPALLLLDEPSTYADNQFEAELYELLKELNEEGLTILMVSHDLGIIPAYVKSIACVNGELHYHPSPEITGDVLKIYNCPIELVAHGPVPHRVLSRHEVEHNSQSHD